MDEQQWHSLRYLSNTNGVIPLALYQPKKLYSPPVAHNFSLPLACSRALFCDFMNLKIVYLIAHMSIPYFHCNVVVMPHQGIQKN